MKKKQSDSIRTHVERIRKARGLPPTQSKSTSKKASKSLERQPATVKVARWEAQQAGDVDVRRVFDETMDSIQDASRALLVDLMALKGVRGDKLNMPNMPGDHVGMYTDPLYFLDYMCNRIKLAEKNIKTVHWYMKERCKCSVDKNEEIGALLGFKFKGEMSFEEFQVEHRRAVLQFVLEAIQSVNNMGDRVSWMCGCLPKRVDFLVPISGIPLDLVQFLVFVNTCLGQLELGIRAQQDMLLQTNSTKKGDDNGATNQEKRNRIPL
ncbi:hypothetical protein BSKO_05476 [Bryopsis sp. KO-2023]|nr:hypothetical protein BSKO_05476 [Bryopsis sp. KO-2023]